MAEEPATNRTAIKSGAAIESQDAQEPEKRFSEQRFLLDHYEYFSNKPQSGTYNNFIQVDGGSPELFYNKIMTPSGLERFTNANPKVLAELVPFIRIWKVQYPQENHPGIEQELMFNTYLSDEDIINITKNTGSRGGGVGVKSFSWNLAGTNMIEAEKLIESNLVILFQDINSFTKKQDNDGPSFLDLIYKENQYLSKTVEDCGTGESTKVWNEKYYRMKIQVGWSAARDSSLGKEINELNHTFYLTMTSHDINFNNDGTMELSLKMQSQIESALSSPDVDVLLMEKNEELTKFQNKLGCLVAETKEKDTLVDMKAVKDKYEEQIQELRNKIKEEKGKQYNNFITKIDDQFGAIYYVDIPSQDIAAWLEERENRFVTKSWKNELAVRHADLTGQGRGNKSEDLKKKIAEASSADGDDSDAPEKKVRYITKGGKLKGEYTYADGQGTMVIRIHYLFLGSILEAAFSVFSNNKKKLQEIRNIVGNIEIIDSITNVTYGLSIADIPISLELFNVWYFDNCVKTQRDSWAIGDFLDSLISELFLPAIKPTNKYDKKLISGSPRLSIRPSEIPLMSSGGNPAIWLCPFTGKEAVKDVNSSGHISGTNPYIQTRLPKSSSAKTGKYLILCIENRDIRNKFICPDSASGETACTPDRESRDQKQGVYHYKIGLNRGLLKTINFKKFDQPALEAMRIHNDGRDGLGGVAQIYNADVDMVGNTLYFPGCYLYIDTSSVGGEFMDMNNKQSLSHKLGLGGYYMVLSVKSSIVSGSSFKTTLECQWQSSGLLNSTQKPAVNNNPGSPQTPPAPSKP